MNAHTPTKPADQLGVFDRFDALAGRADWTWPDYIAEGGRQFDAEFAATGKTYTPTAASRAHHARCWAELNCPPSKRNPAARRAAHVQVFGPTPGAAIDAALAPVKRRAATPTHEMENAA